MDSVKTHTKATVILEWDFTGSVVFLGHWVVKQYIAYYLSTLLKSVLFFEVRDKIGWHQK